MDARFSASYRTQVDGWQVKAPLSAWDDLAATGGGDEDSDRVFPDESACAAAARRMNEVIAARAGRLSVAESLSVNIC